MITEETARKQFETLYKEGSALAKAFAEEEEGESFEEGYQSWVSSTAASERHAANAHARKAWARPADVT